MCSIVVPDPESPDIKGVEYEFILIDDRVELLCFHTLTRPSKRHKWRKDPAFDPYRGNRREHAAAIDIPQEVIDQAVESYRNRIHFCR